MPTTRTSSTGSSERTEYNGCDPKKDDCAALRDKMGVKAVDDKTLEVTLTTPQPWFVQQAAHHSFLAVHKPTVDKFGDKWTEAANIVTNGPFTLERWEHNANIDIVKWDEWRDAASVKLTRVNGRMISDGTTAIQAFEAGELDVNDSLAVDEIPRLRDTETYDQYPGLGTYYYGFNVKKITDVKQRRAMSLAIDRRSIIDNIAQEDQLPTTGFTPKGMPGFDVINPDSPWQPETADMEQAKQLMSEVANPVENINLYINDSPGHREIAVAIQAAWKELGIESTIKQQEFQQYLEFLGPPPNQDVDRLPARLDRRLRRRDQLPRAVDVRLGEQLDELLQQGVRRADREGSEHAGQRRPLRALRAGRGDPRRRERRHADHPDLLLHLHRSGERVGEGLVRVQPAQPGRPDQGRRHRVALLRDGDGALRASRPRSEIVEPGRGKRC